MVVYTPQSLILLTSTIAEFGMDQLKTPVALVLFNRPEPTRRLFEKIAAVRPLHLFLIADGPRSDREGDRQRCEEVRKIISAVNWPCKVEINFSEGNLGCRRRLISGLDWVFSQVEEAIILEDDCIPNTSFFPYCEELLERYRNCEQVGIVSGYNPLQDAFPFIFSYCFTKMVSIWGWATWRRTWNQYDEQMISWPVMKEDILGRLWPDQNHRRYWDTILESMYRGVGPDTWDYQLVFKSWAQRWLNVVPSRNLIQNIGFGVDATHTHKDDPDLSLKAEQLAFPLIHPNGFVEWTDHLQLLQKRFFSPNLLKRAQRATRLKVRKLARYLS